MTIQWPDGKTRCSWCSPKNERYIRYHDEEWGIPVHDDRRLFEMLLLESFQAGLSWECVLNKREAFRRAFDDFDPEKVSRYSEEKMESLRNDPAIIRNRLKIRAAVKNAALFRDIQREYGSFDRYLWGWTNGTVIRECSRTSSPPSWNSPTDFACRSSRSAMPRSRRPSISPRRLPPRRNAVSARSFQTSRSVRLQKRVTARRCHGISGSGSGNTATLRRLSDDIPTSPSTAS